jgi:hypothetical protein
MVELDHVFLFVRDESTAAQMMRDAGLRVNYSRVHPGQGTRNLCACLDDMFLELLWLDGSDISPQSEQVTLGRRGRGDGSPIGVAWRGEAALVTQAYRAPFLPDPVTIPVALASFDASLPFVFKSPGGVKPVARTDGLVGDCQRPALSRLGQCTVIVPDPAPVENLLMGFDKLKVERGPAGLALQLLDADGVVARRFEWRGLGG